MITKTNSEKIHPNKGITVELAIEARTDPNA
jgi:hypothetical protein